MPLPGDYFSSSEETAATFEEFVRAVHHISTYQSQTGSRFAWRGVVDADWPLYSSLVRRLLTRLGRMPTEDELQEAELAILEEARDWSLDWHSAGGRLSALELLAALQHYGTPTRMLDFTFDPLVALWFAVEKDDHLDGRVFAIDISDRMVAREDADERDPWWTPQPPALWSEQSWVWRPPPLEKRIVRQDGCFLIGGIPGTVPGRNVRGPGGWQVLRQEEVQACMSVPFSLIQFEHAVAASEGRRLPGRPPKARAFTLRVQDKAALREELERGYGYAYRSIYPDFPGFRDYASSVPRP